MLSRRRPVLCPTVIRAWNCHQGDIEAVVGTTFGLLKVVNEGFTLNGVLSVYFGLNPPPPAGTKQVIIEANNPDLPPAPPGGWATRRIGANQIELERVGGGVVIGVGP